MKALVVDAEWKPERRLAPLTRQQPMYTFPVLNKPVIEHNMELLCRKGIKDVIISSSEHTWNGAFEFIKRITSDKFNIHLHKEPYPRGTAGILSDVKAMLEDEPFLVVNSHLYIEDIDLEGMIDFHQRKQAVATVGVRRENKNISNIEAVKLSSDGLVSEVNIIHHSLDRRSPWRFSGIYLFTPAVFDFIESQSYFDIKEQLIPLLQESSQPVYAYEADGYYRSIHSMEDYFALHRDLLEMNSRAIRFKDKKEIADRVWVGEDTVISPGTYLKGPIILGNRCHIANRAQIIGPAVLGDECEIAEDAVVRESILWDNVSLDKGASSEYCIVGEGLNVMEGKRLNNLVMVDSLRIGDMNLIRQDYKLNGVGGIDLSKILIAGINNWIFNFIKRTMDISVALVTFVLLWPLYLLIALAIKIDSRGPVFYIQKRCGRDGKVFGMLKFRTMVARAEQMHAELISQKETDGPMFKMTNDPRVTKLGAILRRTSLDELPQLFNVLRGQMSMVGPRPLIMEEMKFSPSWRDVRLRVKPGITGLWQVQGRSEAPFHDWIRYDVEYVMNQSFWLDIKILFKTIKTVLTKVGAH